jgi:predicted peptidase
LATIVLITSNATAKPKGGPAGEARIFKNANEATMPYRLFSPSDLKTKQKYPLVLCFHGAAGRGTENKAKGSLSYSVLTSPLMQKKYPAFIIAPQCPKGKRWVNHHWGNGAYDSKKVTVSDEMTMALAIVDKMIQTLPVDKSRIYVTGRSMGGFATWDAIARRPDFFAAAVPIAGGGDPQLAAKWVSLPIWAVASAGDRTCPVSGTRDVVAALKKIGAKVKYTEDPKKGHGPICNAWKDVKGLGDWLFEQRNTKHNPDAPANKALKATQ